MTTYRLTPHMLMNLEKEGGPNADKEGIILMRHIHGSNCQLRDPETKEWFMYTNMLLPVDESCMYLDGDKPLPTYAKDMELSTPTE